MLFIIRYKTDFEPIEEDILPRYSRIYSGDTAKYVHSITNKTRKNIRNDTFRREGDWKTDQSQRRGGWKWKKKGVLVCFTMTPTIFIWLGSNLTADFNFQILTPFHGAQIYFSVFFSYVPILIYEYNRQPSLHHVLEKLLKKNSLFQVPTSRTLRTTMNAQVGN